MLELLLLEEEEDGKRVVVVVVVVGCEVCAPGLARTRKGKFSPPSPSRGKCK